MRFQIICEECLPETTKIKKPRRGTDQDHQSAEMIREAKETDHDPTTGVVREVRGGDQGLMTEELIR